MSQTLKDVQNKILEIMKYIDSICRDNDIEYYIMGGTALGAVRHGGFIPWDDDLDIFMTPKNYDKFKKVFYEQKSKLFVLQEWRTTDKYLEYAKVRMNGTTFIESVFKDRENMHQGIYVDIMILHKAPPSSFMKKVIYVESKYVTLYALSQRNWKPKSGIQKAMLCLLKLLPNKLLVKHCYKKIYSYDKMKDFDEYCYWITPASFKKGLFSKDLFGTAKNIKFENTVLKAPQKIEEYLRLRYGNYMELPSENDRKATVHAEIYDCERDFSGYVGK